jgi:hypothetical protein
MSSQRWRNLCLLLGTICFIQLWRDCHRAPAPPPEVACPKPSSASHTEPSWSSSDSPDDRAPSTHPAPPAAADGLNLYGFTIPSWALWFAPHPGEDLRAYRDRLLPIVQSAIQPQRDRVARIRDDFAAAADLSDRQRADLDTATQQTASALENRVMDAVMNGELDPSTFKPMAGVSMARDLINIVDQGNHRFLDSLSPDQRAKLAQHPFDFGDNLLFSTPWENVLKFLD